MRSKTKILTQAFQVSFGDLAIPWQDLAPFTEIISVKKNQLIKIAGTTEHCIYYIIKGSGGTFSLKGNKLVCLELCYEGDFFGDYYSMLIQAPSKLETMALEHGELLKIPFQALNKFYAKQGAIFKEKIGRIAAENLYLLKQKQLIDLQTLTAEERYTQLLQKQPHILQRTPIRHIASYLGITPETLSRIRREIAG
ncbi:hypothetical protein BKI52_08940 [marine bacterium AO1-C]|nr:hypothetical protein BKI52_08940 [marine bacterium AO1-C]